MSGIIRVHKTQDYSVVNNAGLRDKRLSFGARGILAYLLSKPDNWQVRSEDLVEQSPAGRDAVQKMLRELEACGYLKRQWMREASGRVKWHTEVFETPQTVGESAAPLESELKPEPEPENPAPGEPQPEFPAPEKPARAEPEREKPAHKERRREEIHRLRPPVREVRLEPEVSLPQTPLPGLPPDIEADAPDFLALQEITGRMWGVGPTRMPRELVEVIRLLRAETEPPATPENQRLFAERWKALGRTKPYPGQVAANWGALMNPPPRLENANYATNSRHRAGARHSSAAQRRSQKWEVALEELGG